ncbi:MAG: hypothetical protein J6W00_11935 [Lentisphaeria bacterium]|nr:hypothetical protein [Lentisphaeria bacterium]
MKSLGIDLGTTKVAVIIYDREKGLVTALNAPHYAALENENPSVGEQDVEKIFSCVMELIGKIPENLRQEVSAIGITGQMHSLLFFGKNGTFSPLVTWQDHRCGKEMIDRFNRKSSLTLREGFGGTTLARMAEENVFCHWEKAATISDALSFLIRGGNGKVITDPTHAASWGIYDAGKGAWNEYALEKLNIPREILPEICESGTVAGVVSGEFAQRFRIPASAVVINAIGDNQASILGTGKDFAKEIYLTLGTGAQLSMVTDKMIKDLPENLEMRPFPGSRYLLVSAPLCGGAAFAWLADTVNNFKAALGEAPIPRGELLDKLDEAGYRFMVNNGESSIKIAPHFLGERHAPELRGEISGLTLANATAGELASALALGIIRNLKSGFPAGELATRTKVIGSGNAVRLVKSIRLAIEREFHLPLELNDGSEEAACGAAKEALNSIE